MQAVLSTIDRGIQNFVLVTSRILLGTYGALLCWRCIAWFASFAPQDDFLFLFAWFVISMLTWLDLIPYTVIDTGESGPLTLSFEGRDFHPHSSRSHDP